MTDICRRRDYRAPMPPLLPEQIADLLDDAADALERYGWTRQQIGNRRIGFCAVGAILNAVELHADMTIPSWSELVGPISVVAQVRVALQRHLDREIHRDLDAEAADLIPYWNDHLAKNTQEVIDTFRAAAKGCR